MLSSIWQWPYTLPILFYVVIVLLMFLGRRRFERHGIVFILRTKFGLMFMKNAGNYFAKHLRWFAYISITLGFAGLIFITWIIIKSFFETVLGKLDTPAVAPVLPGFPIIGTGLSVPLVEGLIALFLVIVIHEASHGVMSQAFKIPIKSSGFVMFGPLPGAFVDPDEKKLMKAKRKEKLAIYSAGPISNVISALVVILLMFALAPVGNAIVQEGGATIVSLVPNSSADNISLPVGATITQINEEQVSSVADLKTVLSSKEVGEQITIQTTNETYAAALGDYEGQAYLGVQAETLVLNEHAAAYQVYGFFLRIIYWFFLLSLGLGLANLLPLGPVDGGRMLLDGLTYFFSEEKAMRIWSATSLVVLVILLYLLFDPFVKLLVA